MKLLFCILAAGLAFSAVAQQEPLQSCEEMHAQYKASFDAEDQKVAKESGSKVTLAGDLYECFAKKADMSLAVEKVSKQEKLTEQEQEEFLNGLVSTCGGQIEAFMQVFTPKTVNIVLAAGLKYQICISKN